MSSEIMKKECQVTAYGVKDIGMVELSYIPIKYEGDLFTYERWERPNPSPWVMIATDKYGNMLGGKQVMKDLPTEEQIRKFWMEQYELGGDGD